MFVPTFKNNIIPLDEFLPSTYSVHPRKDIRDMFIQNMNAVAHIGNPITQFRNETNGGSMTAPIKGIDYDWTRTAQTIRDSIPKR